MKKSKIIEWKKQYADKKLYSTRNRYVFYSIAAKYLPINGDAIILDIGAGDGAFVNYLNLEKKFESVNLLDGNIDTISNLKMNFKNVLLYKAPEKLPFEKSTVDYILCSHIVEHLYHQELYQFIKEIDRVLKKNGIIVINSPLIGKDFFNTLDHVKPYNPEIFISYLCKKVNTLSDISISQDYKVLELLYRYKKLDESDDGWGSSIFLIDFLIHFIKLILSKLRINKYIKNGYTLVLKKGSE